MVWAINENKIQCTMGFNFYMTRTSSISSNLLGLVLKNLGYVLIKEFWTASSAQLYSWTLVCAVGILVILVNTSQSISGIVAGVAMLACIYIGPLIDIFLSTSWMPARPPSCKCCYSFILRVRAVASSGMSYDSSESLLDLFFLDLCSLGTRDISDPTRKW